MLDLIVPKIRFIVTLHQGRLGGSFIIQIGEFLSFDLILNGYGWTIRLNKNKIQT